eukprot:g2273.t1
MSARVAPSNINKIFDSDTSDDEEMEEQIALQTKEIIRMVSQVDERMDNENQRQTLSLTMSQTMGDTRKVTDVVKKRRASVITRSASVANTGDRLTIVKDDQDDSKSKKVLEGMKGRNKHSISYLKKKREEVDRTASMNIGDATKPVSKTLSGRPIMKTESEDKGESETVPKVVTKRSLQEKRNLKKLQQQTWNKTLRQVTVLDRDKEHSSEKSPVNTNRSGSFSTRRRTNFRHDNRRISGRNDYLEPTTTRMTGNTSRRSRVSRIQKAAEKAQEKLYDDMENMKSAMEDIARVVKSNSELLSKVLRHIDGDDSAEESI